MKKVLYLLTLLLIPIFINADVFKTDYIDIDDYVELKNNKIHFNIIKSKINNKEVLDFDFFGYTNKQALYYNFNIKFYDKNKKLVHEINSSDVANSFSDNLYDLEEIKEYDNIKYYVLSLNSKSFKDYYTDMSNETKETEYKNPIKLKHKIITSYNKTNKDDYYYNEVKIDINANRKEYKKYISEISYELDINLNKDLKKLDINIPLNIINKDDLEIKVNNNEYEVNNNIITFKNLKKGNILLKFKVMYKTYNYNFIDYSLYKDNNINSYIKYKINLNTNFKIILDDKYIAGLKYKYLNGYKENDKSYTFNLESEQNTLYLSIKDDIDDLNNKKVEENNSNIGIYVLIICIIIGISVYLYIRNKKIKEEKRKNEELMKKKNNKSRRKK